jgi:hypothetical protein
MKFWIFIFCNTFAGAILGQLEQPTQYDTNATLYANHIFNALHSSMRLFGNALNHNGMSFFLAKVPEETEFYHGTYTSDPVKGMEWLAFEPEHALMFARPRLRHPPPPFPPVLVQRPLSAKHMDSSHPELDNDTTRGYLHTYRTKRELRLVYLDGQSAAKSNKGTLDQQDIVLLRGSTGDDRRAGGDYGRAQSLCRMAATTWEGRIDGIIRMEMGFEIIICDFETTLETVKIAEVMVNTVSPSRRAIAQAAALATRFPGIGGDRVTLNTENFVTLFSFPDAIYFDDTRRPRAYNESSRLAKVRKSIDDLVSSEQNTDVINWQAVVDLIVTRYSFRIEYMTSNEIQDLKSLQDELFLALQPFIDNFERNTTAEIERCTSQFLPSKKYMNSIPAMAVAKVSHQLCAGLSAAFSATAYENAISIIHDLKGFLSWTTWKQCKGCTVGQVCKVPLWPNGQESDFEQPPCVDKMTTRPDDYWRRSGPDS